MPPLPKKKKCLEIFSVFQFGIFVFPHTQRIAGKNHKKWQELQVPVEGKL